MTSTDCDLLFPCNKLSKVGGCWLALVQLLQHRHPEARLSVFMLCYIHPIDCSFFDLSPYDPNLASTGGIQNQVPVQREIVNLAKNFLDSEHRMEYLPQSPVTSPHISASKTGLHSQLLCTEITWAWIRKMGLDLPQNVIWKKNSMLYKMCHQFLIQIKINWFLK